MRPKFFKAVERKFIKQTQKSITCSHQMLAPWRMVKRPTSRKCAGLTRDSCKRALYLKEVCTHHGKICGDVQEPMRLLFRAEHPSPVFRMLSGIQCCPLTQALWIQDYKNEPSYMWKLENTTNWEQNNKKKRSRLTDTEDKLVVTCGGRWGELWGNGKAGNTYSWV